MNFCFPLSVEREPAHASNIDRVLRGFNRLSAGKLSVFGLSY